jgi:hypothetical protein
VEQRDPGWTRHRGFRHPRRVIGNGACGVDHQDNQ